MKSTCIPQALVESDDFSSLHAEQKEGFVKRLLFIQNALQEAGSWLDSGGDDFYGFADGLELDLVSAMSEDLRDTDRYVSTWFIHSTWTFATKAERLAAFLSEQTYSRLDEGFPGFSSSEGELQEWLRSEVKEALTVFDELKAAKEFEQAIAFLIAIDTFLGRLLVVLFKWRLWLPR